MAEINFNTDVRYLSGVGEKRAKQLGRLGISTVKDLLYHFPRAYQHRGNVKYLRDCEDNEVASLMLVIGTEPKSTMVKGRMTLTKFVAFDESGKVKITYFNQGYLSTVFKVGEVYRFYGKVNCRFGDYSLSSPDYEKADGERALPEFTAVYPLTENITQKYCSKLITTALEQLKNKKLPDILPEKIVKEQNLPSLEEALNTIHRPIDYYNLDRARKRFIFEELFLFALAVTVSKSAKKPKNSPVFQKTDLSALLDIIGFEPTNAQKRIFSEIEYDMTEKNGEGMMRLLCGDVGSGKTLCAAAALYMAAMNGYQGALMAPTEILASQHYEDLGELFAKLGIRCELLCGSTTASQKRIIKKGLANGEIKIIIGTHALLSCDVEFYNPGLIVTDEQHRFGVEQRANLSEKGKNAHILVMSATPIPRTLALIMYGDLAISYLDEMPAGRQKVSTFVIGEELRDRMNGYIEKQARLGKQTYIVCPAIDSDDGEALVGFDYRPEDGKIPKLKNATEYAEKLSALLPGVKIALLHGRMKGSEKDRIMKDFAEHKIDVLVSTTVIEVGVNVPNATLMIVENAERFGLSALHQLRGRVGRGKDKSYCILVSDAQSEKSKARLDTMVNTNDGLEIAKTDLKLRGPGDFLPNRSGGSRQHGDLSLGLASLCDNTDDLEKAFEYADWIISNDAKLTNPDNKLIRDALSSYFFQTRNTVN